MTFRKPVRVGAALALLALAPWCAAGRPDRAWRDTAQKPHAPSQPVTQPSRQLTRGEIIAREALSYRGAPYRMGGTSRRGIDCSGLAMKAHKKWGLMLPRTSVEQFRRGTPVAKADLRPGDLVFFRNTYRRGVSHVGIYVGDGKFVHAAGRRKGVVVTPLTSPYHAKHYAGARRLALDSETPGADITSAPKAAALEQAAPPAAEPPPAAVPSRP